MPPLASEKKSNLPAPLAARCCVAALLTSVLLMGLARESLAQSYRRGAWSPVGTVSAIIESGNRVFLGGTFSHLAPPSGGAAFVDAASGIAHGPFPEVHGTALTATEDGSGGWFVGGDFDSVQGQPRQNLAHIDASGLVTAWNPRAGGPVWKLITRGDSLFVGGGFQSMGGVSRVGLAAVDTRSGALLAWNPRLGGWAKDMLLEDSTIVVAGDFYTVGDSSRISVARIGLTSARATGWRPELSGPAYALARTATTVFVGGAFWLGSRHAFAAFDAITAAPWPETPSFSNAIYTLALRDTTLYLGGTFTMTSDGTPRSRLAAISATHGHLLDWAPKSNGTVSCVVATASEILIGGYFSSVADSNRTGTASVHPISGRASAWRCLSDGATWDIHRAGNALLLLGQFRYAGAVERRNLAAIDRETGTPLAWRADTDNDVHALATAGGRLFVGGAFTHAGGAPRSRLAAFDEMSGNLLPWAPGANSTVYALCTVGDRVVVGGSFGTISGRSARSLAVLDATSGAERLPMDRPAGPVYALTSAANRLYVAGSFSTVGASTRQDLAAYSLETGALLPWNPAPNGPVQALAVSGPRVFVAGGFGQIGTVVIKSVAELDSATGMPTAFRTSMTGSARALTLMPGRLFVGGASPYELAEVDLASGAMTNRTPAYGIVYALAPGHGDVHVGGYFYRTNGQVCGHFQLSLAPDSLRIWPRSIATRESATVAIGGEALDDCDECRLVSGARAHTLPLSARGTGFARSQVLFADDESGAWTLECRHRDGRTESGTSINVLRSAPVHPRVSVYGRQRVRRDSWSTFYVTVTGDSLRTARGRIEIPIRNAVGWEALSSSPPLTASDGHGGLQLFTAPITLAPRATVTLGVRIHFSPELGPFNVVGRWTPVREEVRP